MKISVVIGTYNQRDTLKIVLDSFAKQTLAAKNFEIIVIDSSSTDGTESAVRSLNLPYQLNYLRVENKGKAFARNQGVKQAQAEIILLTDADMVAAPDLLTQHVIEQEKHGDVSIEGVTYNLKKPLELSELYPTSPHIEAYIKQELKPEQHLKWSYFLSGNLSLRKQTFIEAGEFDENFSGYGWEDIELGYRLNKMKIPVLYAPEAINYHFHFVTGQDMLKRKYNMGRSAAYFFKKHPNLEIKMFLGMNPLAMGIFLHTSDRGKDLDAIKSVQERVTWYCPGFLEIRSFKNSKQVHYPIGQAHNTLPKGVGLKIYKHFPIYKHYPYRSVGQMLKKKRLNEQSQFSITWRNVADEDSCFVDILPGYKVARQFDGSFHEFEVVNQGSLFARWLRAHRYVPCKIGPFKF